MSQHPAGRQSASAAARIQQTKREGIVREEVSIFDQLIKIKWTNQRLFRSDPLFWRDGYGAVKPPKMFCFFCYPKEARLLLSEGKVRIKD